ncbi:efflux RND transporter periplasmic adaptor subunit [Desulforhopalus sp. IMCC35007]|uniref:efflux RND transporter periplasmic adaptor subunit n=1 Tax=Desulforhopalus sp. IMCC35007 TaxID=2569543 RepID=UPI0010AEA671|nr:efflux RND transporter periplasmic adaptor subunit [Desulforhopalus sp. IMCC35007]TKB06023.1 efflux RND transporter periplasmic adaptor subunit [Desulforhopalus sp. IMCC35007]
MSALIFSRIILVQRTLLPLLFITGILLPLSAISKELTTLQPFYRSVTLSGFTYPRQEMTVTSEVSGRCEEIVADIGEPIPENGILATIDPTFILLDITANTIAQEQTERQLAQEEKTLSRYTTLLSKKSTPQAQLDEVSLATDLHHITLKKLVNEEKRLKEQLKRHTLKGPQGWLVIERFAEQGEYIQAGKPIARLGDFQRLIVPLALTYSELQALNGKQPISLFFPDLGAEVPATIYRSAPVSDASTRKIHVDLITNAKQSNLQQQLQGGMRAEVQLISGEDTGSFLVPHSALINRYEASWLVAPDGRRIQVILVGHSDDDQFSIVSGSELKAGQQVQLSPDPLQ